MRASPRTSARACSSACSALLLLGSCAPAAEPVIALDVRTELPHDRPKIEAHARAALGEVGLAVRPAKAGERRWQATVTAAPARGEVEVAIELRALDKAEPGAKRLPGRRYRGSAWVPGGPDAVALGAERAARDLVALVALEVATDAEIVAAVDGADLARAARAVEQVRERKLGAAMPKLLALIGDPGERVMLVPPAIGALIALDDPRSVGALIGLTKNRPPVVLMPIIFAVAEIGGREAEAWLFTVASGHPDRGVRDAAKQALGELERRRPVEEERE